MGEYVPNAVYLKGLMERENFYNLAGADGCRCGWLTIRFIEMHVHCWKTSGGQRNSNGKWVACGCRWAGIHITGRVGDRPEDLLEVGKVIRKQLDRPDMAIPIVIHQESDASEYVGYVDNSVDGIHLPLLTDINTPVGDDVFAADA